MVTLDTKYTWALTFDENLCSTATANAQQELDVQEKATMVAKTKLVAFKSAAEEAKISKKTSRLTLTLHRKYTKFRV